MYVNAPSNTNSENPIARPAAVFRTLPAFVMGGFEYSNSHILPSQKKRAAATTDPSATTHVSVEKLIVSIRI